MRSTFHSRPEWTLGLGLGDPDDRPTQRDIRAAAIRAKSLLEDGVIGPDTLRLFVSGLMALYANVIWDETIKPALDRIDAEYSEIPVK